ncbi:MAG: hypothetical protein MHMPM18_004340, partial [Marteilia pararefringens]
RRSPLSINSLGALEVNSSGEKHFLIAAAAAAASAEAPIGNKKCNRGLPMSVGDEIEAQWQPAADNTINHIDDDFGDSFRQSLPALLPWALWLCSI